MDIDRTISVFLQSKLWQIVKVLGQGDLVEHNTVVDFNITPDEFKDARTLGADKPYKKVKNEFVDNYSSSEYDYSN